MHGFTRGNKSTWQPKVTGLAEKTKWLKSTTLSGLLGMLVLVTTGHIKIHGLDHCKVGMNILLKHTDMMLKR